MIPNLTPVLNGREICAVVTILTRRVPIQAPTQDAACLGLEKGVCVPSRPIGRGSHVVVRLRRSWPVGSSRVGPRGRVVETPRGHRHRDRAPGRARPVPRAAARVIDAGPVERRTAGPHDTRHFPAVTVLIPARDEVAHIGSLIADLGRQELVLVRWARVPSGGRHRRSVGGRDRCARDGGDRRRRFERMRHPPGWPRRDQERRVARGAAPCDRRCEPAGRSRCRRSDRPDFIRGVAEHHAAGNASFTARRRIAWADHSWLLRVQDDEQALDSWVLAGRIGRAAGVSCGGNGMAVAPEALAAAAGGRRVFSPRTLEVSASLLSAGITISWAGHLVVDETGAGTPTALSRQRVRWAEDRPRRFLNHLPRALSARGRGGTLGSMLAVYAGQLLLAPLILGACVPRLASGRPGRRP